MSARFHKKGEYYEIRLQGEPQFCHALQMSPPALEPLLTHGTWLVLLAAVWSSPDLLAIDTAVSLIKNLAGQIQLGIRPFDNHDETKTWCPEAKERHGSPVWLLLKGGHLIREWVGLRTESDLRRLVEAALG